jgi:hypothetical protein
MGKSYSSESIFVCRVRRLDVVDDEADVAHLAAKHGEHLLGNGECRDVVPVECILDWERHRRAICVAPDLRDSILF